MQKGVEDFSSELPDKPKRAVACAAAADSDDPSQAIVGIEELSPGPLVLPPVTLSTFLIAFTSLAA